VAVHAREPAVDAPDVRSGREPDSHAARHLDPVAAEFRDHRAVVWLSTRRKAGWESFCDFSGPSYEQLRSAVKIEPEGEIFSSSGDRGAALGGVS